MNWKHSLKYWFHHWKHSLFHSLEVAGKQATLSDEGRRMLVASKAVTVAQEKKVLSGSISDRLRHLHNGL